MAKSAAKAAASLAPVSDGPVGERASRALSVVIPHYEDLANLDRCLGLLQTQTLAREAYEIIVSDNVSPVGIEAVRELVGDRAKVILSTEKGAGVTRNAGVSASSGAKIAFIDSDCRPEPEFLAEGVAMLAHYDIVGGAIRVDIAAQGKPTPSEAFELVFAFHNERYIREKRFSVTAALFTSRPVFDAVGPFRMGVSEDLDWGNRATAMGYTIGFAKAAIVGHPARRTWPELARKWRRLTEEAFLLSIEKPLGRSRWIAHSWVAFAATGPHLVKVARSPRLAGPSSRLAAMGVLIRLRMMRVWWSHCLLLRTSVP
jgi:glycosyltransferase involved in cell wall biosynthesis